MSANPVVNEACVVLYQTPHTRLRVQLASGNPLNCSPQIAGDRQRSKCRVFN
jgi:hypothetical protein